MGGTPVAHALLDTLTRRGIRQLFCCPGSTEAALLDALVDRDDVELVLVTHESVAVAAAEGLARLTGRPTAAYLHTNVGLANAVAHLTSATLAHAPVVVINGMKATGLSARGGFTTAPHPSEAARQYVKAAVTAESGASVAQHADRLIRLAVTEPAGPVWLGLPQDVLESSETSTTTSSETSSERRRDGTLAARTRPSASSVAAAVRALRVSRRPVLIAGGDVARHRGSEALLRLAQRLGATVLFEGRRDFTRSSVPTDHPLVAGGYGPTVAAVREADLLLFVGCRLFTEFEMGAAGDIPPGPVRLHAHVDPAEIGRLHAVDVGLAGHIRSTIEDLLDGLGPVADREPWFDVGPQTAPPAADSPFPGHRGLDAVVRSLDAALSDAPTVVLDATTASGSLLEGLTQHRADQLHSSTSGSLGWGMGAAVGMAYAQPGAPVVAILGDGVFQFGIQALWTVVRYRLPVVFVVLNNASYSAVASALYRFNGAAARTGVWPGTDIAGPDLAAVAAGFGLWSRRVRGTDGLTDAVAEALRHAPALLDVNTVTESFNQIGQAGE